MSKITHYSLGTINLSTEANTVCTNAEEYYALEGTFSDGNLADFTLDTDTGILTYVGSRAKVFCFSGTSDLKCDKTATVTYALAVNGNVVTTSSTPTTFEHANSYGNISIIKSLTLSPNDTLQVKMKSDTATTTVTVNTLNCLFQSGVGLK